MDDVKLTDEKTYRQEYYGGNHLNDVMEVKATKDGLEVDESVTVPWEWILKALARVHVDIEAQSDAEQRKRWQK